MGDTFELDQGLRSMFDRMLEGIQLIDRELRYRYLNETAARHGQRARDELLGRRMTDAYPGIDQTEMFRHLEKALRDGVPQRLLNEFTYPNGERGWFDLHMAPVPQGVLVLSVDVTEQKRAESELRRSITALEEADRRKTQLLTMLAHELRNPLAPLRNGLELLRARLGPDADSARAAGIMDRQLTHLGRLVDDLLETSRLVSGKVSVALRRDDLARLVRDCVADNRGVIEGAGLTLIAELPEIPVWAEIDASRVSQALSNILDNARKFTPAPGEVAVIFSASDAATARITVRDTGVGISEAALHFIFDPLYQADTSLERTRGGLGMGLSVARSLLELHGGSVVAKSDGEGRGSVVTIELPRLTELPALEGDAMPPAEASRVARVLIIEDNRDAADTLAMILGLWGYKVTMAHTGPEGVERARALRPDIVLCDIGLPGMDGYAVARAIRDSEKERRARLIAITGYGGTQDRDQALTAGFDLHLAKPVHPERLREELELVA